MFFWNTQPRYVYVPTRVVRRAPAPRYTMTSLLNRIIEDELEDFFAPPPPPPQMFYIRYHYPYEKPSSEEKPQEKKEEKAPEQTKEELKPEPAKEETPKEQPKTEEAPKSEEAPKTEENPNTTEESPKEEPTKEEAPKTEEELKKDEKAEEDESESESMDEDEDYVSSRTSVYRGKGGLIHTVTEEQNGRTGKVVITEERRIGDRAMTLHRTLNADGTVEEEYETRDNLDGDDALEVFKNDWISLAPKKSRSLK